MSHTTSMNYLILHLSFEHVHQPTHEKGHNLDLIITRSSDRILVSEPVADELFSDHFSISCSLSLLKPQLTIKEVSIRQKSIDLPLFFEDLAASELCTNTPDDLETLLHSYNTTLRTIYEHHAPSRTKTIVTRHLVPWFNNTTKHALQCYGAIHVTLMI